MAILKVNGEAVEQFYDPSIPEEALKVFLSENYGDDVDYEIVLVGQELKHYGVEFDGVLCSATERDQNGLIGAKIWIEAGGRCLDLLFDAYRLY